MEEINALLATVGKTYGNNDLKKMLFTNNEFELMELFIKRKIAGDEFPIYVLISDDIALDFIGWDDAKCNDVLICKTNSKIKR